MTSIFLAGAENPTHQKLLIASGANRVGVNVASLLRRVSNWSLDLPTPDWEWVAYADGPVDVGDLELVIDRATKPPVAVFGPEGWSVVENYLPLWNGLQELPQDRSEGLVVTDFVFKDKALARKALSTRKGTILGALTGSTDSAISKFDFVVSSAWWSVMKFGETQVWDGRKMYRYSAKDQAEVRQKHASDIEALGIDPDLILAGEPDEVARLAIASWMAYSASLDRSNVVVPLRQGAEATTEAENDPAIPGSGSSALDTPPSPARQRTMIPVMGMDTIKSTMRQGDGTEIVEEQPILSTQADSVRQCDNCFLGQSGCPGFIPGASCGYSIPVKIESKDQLQAMLQAIIELQTQRVLQSRFAEEIQGQELTNETGREMDRLFKLVEQSKDILDDRDVLKLTMQAKAGSGVLSRLFGEKVGTNARMLEHPVDSDEIIDATLVD